MQVRIYFLYDQNIYWSLDKSAVNEGEIIPSNAEQDEDESEASFSDEQNGLLDRLGVKIDDSLHKTFTAYETFLKLLFE